MVIKHTNEPSVGHDYELYAMVKAAKIGDLNVHANFLSETTPCHKCYMKNVKYHEKRLPDLRSVLSCLKLEAVTKQKRSGMSYNHVPVNVRLTADEWTHQ